MNKYCPDCQKNKSIDEFYRSSQTKDGLFGFCKSCCRTRQKERNLKNPDLRRNYRKRNKEILSKKLKTWRAENKTHVLAYKKRYETKRKREDVGYRILCNIRNRIGLAIKNNSKSSTTQQLLGCTIHELKNYLESQFKNGMSWNNYGRWHIDHIKPCASYDLTIPSEQFKCFHYSNLQPLWAEENLRKGKFNLEPLQP